ncbi:alpha/beta fold hydrolase [Sphingomonas flavalba]|uniref:alpha/beta fold hydrolase n=1 Tax=Sphingomonas flavalba TaxID=2559804 RepID=UPI0039DF9082
MASLPAAGATMVHDIPVADGTVRIEVAGEGLPLVLLHGWSLDRGVWHAQLGALAARFQVIAVDRRGFGASTAPPGLADEDGDLFAILDRLGLARAVIVGMSQGGRVALHFAMAHPDRVIGVVLQGAPLDGFLPGPRGDDRIPIASYAALVRSGRIDRMKALWRKHPLMRVDDPAARRTVDRLLAAYQARDLAAAAPPPLTPLAGELDAIYAPALVLTGEQDTPWRRLVADALAYGLPNARRMTIAAAGHLCNLTHADAYNAALASFVDRIRSPLVTPA